jgi:hypothetical protein
MTLPASFLALSRTRSKRIASFAFAAFAGVVLATGPVHAQNQGTVAAGHSGYATAWRSGRGDGSAFQNWTDRYLVATSPNSKQGLLAEGIGLTRGRRAFFNELIRTNPAEALALTVPVSVLKQLPGQITNALENRVSGIGDYTIVAALSAKGGPAVEPVRRFVRINGRTYEASVYGRRLGGTTKFGIPLSGVAVGDRIALDENVLREFEAGEVPDPAKRQFDLRTPSEKISSSPGVLAEMGGDVYRFGSQERLRAAEAHLEKLESALGPNPSQPAAEVLTNGSWQGSAVTPSDTRNPPSAWTTGMKKVLIIRVDFSDLQGAPEGLTTNAIQNVADTQVKPYYEKSSYSQTDLTNTVTTQVYRMPHTASYYATNYFNDTLHTDAENAASGSYTISSYDRTIVFFSSLGSIPNSQITYGGLAQIGAGKVWCNGEFDFRVIAHELGHTYGLYHANLWQVSDGNPISPGGSSTEYGDEFDTMGANYANSLAADFNAWFKNLLGWLSDAQVVTVTTNGTYRVYAFDHDNYVSAPGETLALKIVKDSTHNYWLSCRRDFTNNTSMSNGAYIIWGYNSPHQSDLLDMTTPGSSDQDAALATGAIFTDTSIGLGVTFHPVAKGGTAPNEYRDIQITFGTLPPLAPTFSQQPSSQNGFLGQNVAFTAAASGNPAPGYQWQRKANGSSSWSNLADGGNYSGSATSNLTAGVTDLAMSGDQFRCMAYNSAGSATSSPPAILTVNSGLYVASLAGQVGLGGNGNGQGTNAQFDYPFDVTTDRGGNIYVADYGYGLVRKITPAGVVSTLPGLFYTPKGVAVDANTNVYVADTSDELIQRVAPDGTVTSLAGSGQLGSADGTNTTASFNKPWGIGVDTATNIYVADAGNDTIRKITRIGSSQNWAVTTIAGLAGNPGTSDGTNNHARFYGPASLAVDAARNIYVADATNNTIRKLTPDGTGTNWVVTTIAGQAGVFGYADGLGTNATFYQPSGIAIDAATNLYIADSFNSLIRKITPQGIVTTLAGKYSSFVSADGFYTNAEFKFPYGVAVDNAANIYVADTFNYTIRVGRLASVVVPTLALTASNHQAALSWPVPIQPFALEYSTNLSKPNWVFATNQPLASNGRYYVTNAANGAGLFYRLRTP